jgi:NinB protein
MRITRTIRTDGDRAELRSMVGRVRAGTRVTLEDPEASEPQRIRLRIMLDELARRAKWNGRKITGRDWRRMFLAVVRRAEIGEAPGEEDAVFVMFERDDTPSIEEASNMIEMAHQFAAERGWQFRE